MYQKGNPLLKPSNSYIAEWRTGWKFINFSASYTYVDDYISTDFYTDQDTNPQIVSSYSNFDKIQYLKANLTLQKTFKWWRPSLTAGFNKPLFEYEYLGKKYRTTRRRLFLSRTSILRCLKNIWCQFTGISIAEGIKVQLN